MKRSSAKAFFALVLAVVLVLGLGAPAFAASVSVSTQNLTVNGESVECEKYTIDGYNYFKLRDLAQLLNGTNSQFDVDYDKDTKTVIITTDHAYTTPDGTELTLGTDKSATAVPTTQTVMVDGEVRSDLTAYNIGGNNYFKLRELGKVLHYYVDWDKATGTAKVKEQREEEDWETGDASLDNPRNQDGIGETELLIVSFGTSFNANRVATIGAIENAMEKAFPGYSVRRGFTAQIIIDHVYDRDDEKIDNMTQALDRAVANGVKTLIVQPTHLMNGYEYNDVVEELRTYEDKFDDIVIGAPLLSSDEDYDVVIKAITEGTKEYLDGQTAICFMGHGTEADSNHIYADFQAKLAAAGYKDYFIGTVEATPTLEEVVEKVKAAGYKKVVLEPLMIVAGDHANNDMADPEDPESWYSLFAAEGIEATCLLRGLGEFPEIQQLLVEHTKAAVAEKLDEDFDTGDASKDNPRNQDGIGPKELLVVSFGTSFNDNRVATIGAIENAMEKAFPDYSVRRGFTAQIIIDHVFRRDGEKIDNFGQALNRAVANGVKELLIQPTHLMDGYEYNDVVEELKSYEGKFEKITIGKPLLTSEEDYQTVIKAITDATKEYVDGKTAICFMGHGTEAASNHIYADFQAKLAAAGYKDYFIGTVEATPTLEEVVEKVKAAGYKKVVLEPLMIVAGDHANNDMADPEDPESWYSLFAAEGIEVTCLIRGLGEFPAIQQLLVEHAKAAEVISDTGAPGTTTPVAETPKEIVPTGEPTRDIADRTQMITASEVVEEGMTPITADKINDGVYSVKVKSSSSMFKITDAKLTVKDGKMNVEISMSGKSYIWMFMGPTDNIAAADKSEFIPAMKDANDVYSFTLPVNALDEGFFCAAYSKNKDQWYARTLLVRADSLPAGALK